MKIRYDLQVDALTIIFSEVTVDESDEIKPGVIVDFDKNGVIVGMEILDASKVVGFDKAVSFEYAPIPAHSV